MSPTKTIIRPSAPPHPSLDESYCSPWDLQIQEEKLKLLNKQYQTSVIKPSAPPFDDLLDSSNVNNESTSSSYNHNHNHRNKSPHVTCSLRRSSSIKTRKPVKNVSLISPEPSSLPTNGLLTHISCNQNPNSIVENHQHKILSGTDTSRSFLFSVASSSTKSNEKIDTKTKAIMTENSSGKSSEITLIRLKHLSSSVQNNAVNKMETCYDQPWDKIQKSLLNNLPSPNNRNSGSLQQIPYTEKTKQRCSHTEEMRKFPIDRYFWYHHGMSRRQAEHILQSRQSGSFLVRQCESGNQNDYSLSVRTVQGCMHMRICYSAGFYILGECSRPFSSISCMIKYFSQVSVPIYGAAHIKLGTPVLRCEILSTSSRSNEELL